MNALNVAFAVEDHIASLAVTPGRPCAQGLPCLCCDLIDAQATGHLHVEVLQYA